MSCAVTRTREPLRCTEPSSTASTFSSRPISASLFFVPLYAIAEVREITRSDRICASCVMSSSVMPSAKYSCSASPEKFASGRTAIDWMPPAAPPGSSLRIVPALMASIARIARMARARAPIATSRRVRAPTGAAAAGRAAADVSDASSRA